MSQTTASVLPSTKHESQQRKPWIKYISMTSSVTYSFSSKETNKPISSYSMEVALLLWSLTMGAVVFLIRQWWLTSIWERKMLPPGPFPLPIVGNMLQLSGMPHRSITDLVKIHGPLMTLKLGLRTIVVISSAQVAREAILNNDLALSGRSVPDSVRALDHHKHSVAWLPTGQMWRDLRRLYNSQLFTQQKLDGSRSLRLQKVRELVEFVGRCCDKGRAVAIGQVAFTTTLNLLSNTVFSVDLASYDSESSQEFKNLVRKIMLEAGESNFSDFFPFLSAIDPQGKRGRLEKDFLKLHHIFDDFIGKRKISMLHREIVESTDVLDAFLSSVFDDETIKSTLTDIFVAGSETTSNTVEWAMAELLQNPNIMTKAQLELTNSIPKDKELDESDISQLSYLQAIVKETFRLHPPIPLLLPRRAEKTVDLCGYKVPKHTQVFINIWAIGRDRETWGDPDVFRPERFLEGRGTEVDFRGRDFELIPFGVGRRICPGLPLGFRMVHLILASLLRSSGWKLPDGMKPGDVDMRENVGLTMALATPLVALPIKQE